MTEHEKLAQAYTRLIAVTYIDPEYASITQQAVIALLEYALAREATV